MKKNEKMKIMKKRMKKRKNEKMEQNDEKRMKNEEIWIHTPGFTVVVTFSANILDDVHDVVSECVSFPRKINSSFWEVSVFPKKSENVQWT